MEEFALSKEGEASTHELERVQGELSALREKYSGMETQWQQEKAAIEKTHKLREQIEQVNADIERAQRVGDNETASINRMVWALKIPSGDFKYPIEKQSLGLYKNGVLTGAYMMMDHSYGQWIADHTSSIDWFLYPTVGLVY
jgi:hypothetical protein